MNSKVLKGLKIAGNVVFYVIIIGMLLFSVANIRKKDKTSFANLFGYGFLVVESESMKGDLEDNFDIGDLVIVKKVSKKDIDKLKVGDIITFYDSDLSRSPNSDQLSTFLNTHRIVHINENGDSKLFVTQGDYNVSVYNFKYIKPEYDSNGNILNPDQFKQNGLYTDCWEEVSDSNVLAVYKGHSSFFGKVFSTVHNNFFVCVVLPVMLLFLFEIVVVILNIINMKNEKAKNELSLQKEELRKEVLSSLADDEKEALKRQLLEELKKEMESKKEE